MDTTYYTASVTIRGGVTHSPGLATVHESGTATGHVTVFLPDGNVSVSADTPEALRSLSVAFAHAADELEVAQHQSVPA